MSSKDNLTPEDRDLVESVCKRWHEAKKQHDLHRPRFEHFYRLYRSYTAFKRDRVTARTRNDQDDVWRGAQRQFGELMFIPYVFATIETTLPRMLSQNPTMIVKPRERRWEDNADRHRTLLEVQQQKIGYPLITQDVAKDGLIYGLGAQKTWWEKRSRSKITLEEATAPQMGAATHIAGKPRDVVEFNGPMAQALDPFDFLWDPLADSSETLRYAFHRSWRDEKYVRDMIEQKKWTLPDGIDVQTLVSGTGPSDRDEVWKERMAAAGLGSGGDKADAMKLHEVWEYHDGREVITVLDAWAPVQRGENPYWHGCLPFHVYRPTKVPHEMVGIGEAEAIEDLNEEMNELRTSRRDNARLALQRPFAYWDGMVDPNDFEFGPAKMWPVDGDPRTLIFPIPIQDIPQSSYNEAGELKSDMQYVSGIDDATAGAGNAQATATGTQLVQAAANVRITNKVLRLEHEVIGPTAQQWIALNQQKITGPIEFPGAPKPGETDRGYSWYTAEPGDLEGEFELEVVGGSMQPDNPVQDRDDAMAWMNMFGQNPAVDQAKLVAQALGKAGLKDPDSLIRPQEPQVPLHALEEVRMALEQAASQDPQALAQLLDPQVFDQLVQGAAMPPQPGEAPTGGVPTEQGGDPAQQPAVPAPPQG